MECAECGIRSSVGYCHECEILLCEVCSNVCERCEKVVCRSHIQRSSSGRTICVSCVVANYDKRARQSKELRERRAERAELGRKTRKSRKKSQENLSFENLNQDAEPTPVSYGAADARDFGPEAVVDTDAINARVLTGSARARTPVWISGLAMGVVSWILCVAAIRAGNNDVQQGILNLSALLISLGTVVWTVPGALSREPGPQRTRSRIAVAIGGTALLLALALFAARM